MAMGLLYKLSDMVKHVYYVSLKSIGCFVTGTALTGDHYRTNIINDMGHPRLDPVVPLVLCIVAYNIRSTGVVLLVPWDSANPTENE
jgi:hypothetical protein